MAKAIEIRPLTRDDDRSAFRCGQADLDRFFHDYAALNQFKLHVTVTYIAVTDDSGILGFATTTVGNLERKTLPSKRLRRRLPGYALPVLRLARLGVDEHVQGDGVERALHRHIFSLALDQRDSVGCVGVVADAVPEAVDCYTSYGFTGLGEVREGALHGDPKPLFLPIAALAAARDG